MNCHYFLLYNMQYNNSQILHQNEITLHNFTFYIIIIISLKQNLLDKKSR